MGSAGSLPGTPSCGQVVPANKNVPSAVAAGSPAGTYVAEQTSSWLSPAQYTLVSSTGASSRKGDARGVSSRRRHNLQDGSCTELAALRSLEPLLTKTTPAPEGDGAGKEDDEAELMALLEGSAEVSSITKAMPSPSKDWADLPDVYRRLYPTKRQLGSCETPDMSNEEEFFDWLCRPPPGMFLPSECSTTTGGISRSLMDSSMHASSHQRSVKSHGTHYDLFASLPGSLCSETRRRRPASPVGRPASPGGRKLRTLEDRIQPIVAIGKSAVDSLKANEIANGGAPPHLSLLEPLQGARTGTGRGTQAGRSAENGTLKGAAQKVLLTVSEGKRKSLGQMGTVEQMAQRAKEKEDAAKAVVLEGSGADGPREGGNIPKAQREAAEAFRALLFGSPPPREGRGGSSASLGGSPAAGSGAANGGPLGRSALSSPQGTRRELVRLAIAWARLDGDHAGRVTALALREFAKKEGLDEKLLGTALGRKSSFVLEDLLRILWPCAAQGDVKVMASCVADFNRGEIRAKSPSPLTKEEYEALAETFRSMEQNGSGYVEVAELVKNGLRPFPEFDDDDCRQLNETEFCEMMCDNGRRINASATVACDAAGNRIVFEESIGWLRKDLWESFEGGTSKA